jgi:glycosyltransferase involved in cell wall biosynthesis
MRVLMVHNRYRSDAPSGENRVVDEEAALLAEGGHTVELFQVSSDGISAFGLTRRALLPAQLVWSPGSRRDLGRAIAAFEPDVVHLHNTFPLLSASVLAATRAAGVPVVATLHNYRLICAGGTLFRDGAVCHDCLGRSPLPGVRHGCYRESSIMTVPGATSIVVNTNRWHRDVDTFIVLSEAQRDLFVGEGFPADRVVVKPNFVRERPAVRSGGPPGREPEHILYLGRLAPEKGVSVLRRAWEQHRPAGGFRHRLVIAGGGPLADEVRAWAEVDRTVEFVGHRTPEECAALMAGALAVVVPSVWEETFGLVVVEAKAAGVPAVATDHASFPDLIEPGRDGLLVPPGDPAALAEALAGLDAAPDRAAAMGASARASYEQRYTPEQNLQLLEGIYRRAVRRGGEPALSCAGGAG